MEHLFFSVAEVPFVLHSDSNQRLKGLLPSYAPFHVKAKEAAASVFEVSIDLATVEPEADDELIFKFETMDMKNTVYRRKEGGYVFIIRNAQGEEAAHARTDAHFSRTEVQTFGEQTSRAMGLNNVIMMAFAFASAHEGVLLIHSSVVFRKGRAHLFLGASGTGKSTHSSLWLKHIEGTDLLNDDNPAIRFDAEHGATAYGTPWSGKTPCYRQLHFPAGSIVRLHQAPHNRIHRLQGIEAFSAFAPSCSMMQWDKYSSTAELHTIEQVVKSVPVFDLECLPDAAAAQLCCQTVESAE